MEIKKFNPKMPEFIKKMPKWLKITSAAALVIIIAVIIFATSRAGGQKKATEYTDYTVARGNISVEITGSGAVEPIDQYEVKPLVSGDIIECYIEEGQMVEKGDLLYKIDTKDIENTIERAQNSLEKAQIAYDDAIEMRDDLKVKAPINGTITAVYAKEGDNIGNGGKVVDIIDSSVMELEIPFLANDAANIYAGQSATVTLANSYYRLTGTVSRVTTGTFVSPEGVSVCNIYINVNNPGAIAKGDGATATVGGYACNSAGTFDYNDTRSVTAKVSGEVINMPFKVGDRVSAGETILTIDGDNVNDTIRNATYSLKDAKLSLQNAQDQLDNYNITAPIAGKVIKKTSKTGDSIESGGGASIVMAVIADMSKIVFDISVDELDITKLSVDQEVNITADAFEDRRFSGRVDYVSSIGTTSNGVTTYPVTIEITNPEGLIPGMNVDANIVVESKENVLMVPVGAINRGNSVTVKKGTETERVKVETGINNDDFIEIISGLNEGDIIQVPVTSSSSTGFMMPGMGGGMPGGMGGGMPAGGMGGGGERPSGMGGGGRQ
ncbi:MAG: HlyD family efflux transporter periplasmic adaptor subunit [Clostridia bacterium]|nr:HlyD family efflux transporter periplasmic adaptor subunit [Clostridia bacterium]